MKMQYLLSLVVFFVSAPLQADDAAKDVVDRALKARATRPELLDKQKRQLISMEGKIYNSGELTASREMECDWPSSVRWKTEFMSPNGRFVSVLALQDDEGWSSSGGAFATEMLLKDVAEFKMELHGRWLAQLYPLRESGFELTSMQDGRVGEEDVSVIKVTAKNRPDVMMSFSKKTNHLLKVSYKARESGIEMRKEHHFNDYKGFEGLMLPEKLVDTKQVGSEPVSKVAEWKVTSYKFIEKFPDDHFAKPEKK